MSRPVSRTNLARTNLARTNLDRLRERIRRIEGPRSHGVLPFGIAAIDRALPGGGLPLGALHEVLGAGGDEEDGAAAAGFIAGILARLGAGTGSTAAAPVPLRGGPGQKDVSADFLPLRPPYKLSLLRPKPVPDASRFRPLAAEGSGEAGMDVDGAGRGSHPEKDGAGDRDGARRQRAGKAGPGSGPVLWCLGQPDLYGPGLLAHGMDPARIVLVIARRGDEVLWAAEEALRAGSEAGLAAVVAEIGRLPIVAGRRLQLAAERSGTTAFLLRRWRSAAEAAAERERPNPALTRWRITALPSIPGAPLLRNPLLGDPLPQWGRGGEIAAAGALGSGSGRPRWRVELLRARGGVPGSWEVEIADATGHVRLSAGLADRPGAPPRSCAGATARETG